MTTEDLARKRYLYRCSSCKTEVPVRVHVDPVTPHTTMVECAICGKTLFGGQAGWAFSKLESYNHQGRLDRVQQVPK